jgi:hypothetical protein
MIDNMMCNMKTILFTFLFSLPFLLFSSAFAQKKDYPQKYFRNPVNIPMQLVANFGELRSNHWHMGLDVRTQQRENIPVVASAEGYIARVKIEPGGFGRAIYINHPNGYTTLYAHLNNFKPDLEKWLKEQQYKKESWAVDLALPENLFPVKKGEFIAYSGNTGGSAGPHVHYEIRDTKTENVVNPLLFGFSIADGVAPVISRLAMYDRNRSVYVQSPQLLQLKRSGNNYTPLQSNLIKVGTDKVSFAIGAVDFFTGSTNPNGIYSARIYMDDVLESEFVLDDISYNDTRYLNAQIDYRYRTNGGAYVQHVSRMPGDKSKVYTRTKSDGAIYLNNNAVRAIRIEVRDAAQNLATVKFNVQLDNSLKPSTYKEPVHKLIPNQVNVFEADNFEASTTENTVYDTVHVTYSATNTATAGAISAVHNFVGASIPAHDAVTVRIKPTTNLSSDKKDKVIIKSVAGTRTEIKKAKWNNDFASATFRQFGSYQAFIDDQPPTINNPPTIVTSNSRIVFTPKDNFNTLKNFRAELNGKWLRFTNDKGRTWIYTVDEHFPPGNHELKVSIEDEAGNVTQRTWNVRRN